MLTKFAEVENCFFFGGYLKRAGLLKQLNRIFGMNHVTTKLECSIISRSCNGRPLLLIVNIQGVFVHLLSISSSSFKNNVLKCVRDTHPFRAYWSFSDEVTKQSASSCVVRNVPVKRIEFWYTSLRLTTLRWDFGLRNPQCIRWSLWLMIVGDWFFGTWYLWYWYLWYLVLMVLLNIS